MKTTIPTLLAALALLASWATLQRAHATPETWTITGSMNSARSGHTATLLTNGKVLVVGGDGTSSAEIYDPATATWTNTDSMARPHDGAVTTLLVNGKVLVAGGNSTSSAEIYDPETGTWTDTGSMGGPRGGAVAALLASGKVLVAGGSVDGSTLSSAEIYDPATENWTSTGSMRSPRRNWPTATLLADGKVLVAGGHDGNDFSASAEIYDPATGTWTDTGGMGTQRGYYTATLLNTGKVLAVGGINSYGWHSSAEIYDPATGTWSSTGEMMFGARYIHAAALLANGKVLVAGGQGFGGRLSHAELYDPTTGTWSGTGSMTTARSSHRLTLLANGMVLATGGSDATSELYDFGTFTITLGASVHGEITGNSSPYLPGTTASLTATPDLGCIFTGWTGDATGNINPLTILMDSDKSLTALFTQDTADPDNDNLTNYQELVIHGTNPDLWDTDGDGFSDGYEVSTGYDPKSNTSSPDTRIAIYTAVEVEFGAGLGKTYRVESSTDLQTWTPVESNIPGNGGTITRLYSIRSIPHRFFRAVRETP